MPAKDQRDPASTNSIVLAYYTANPGFMRCVTVARALGLPTHKVATVSRDLMARGDLERVAVPAKRPGARPITHYGVRDGALVTVKE